MLAFRATYNKLVTIDFHAYETDTTTAMTGVTLKSSVNEGTTWTPVTSTSMTFDDSAMVKYDSTNQVLVITFEDTTTWYKYFFNTVADEPKYTNEGWFNVVTDPTESHTALPSSATELSTFGADTLDFASEYTKNALVKFDLNNIVQTVYTISAGGQAELKTYEKYFEPGSTFVINEDKTEIKINGSDTITLAGAATTDYKYNKSLVVFPEPTTAGQIDKDTTFTFHIDTHVSLVVDPEGAGTIQDSTPTEVTEA